MTVPSADAVMFEVVRICTNRECPYAEFGFQSGTEVHLYRDPAQHELLCVLAHEQAEVRAEDCPDWKQAQPMPVPKKH